MRRVAILSLLTLLAACSGDEKSVLHPPTTTARSVTQDDFAIAGFTTGPTGQIVSEGNYTAWSVCGRYSVIAPSSQQMFWTESECRSYAIPAPGGGTTYDGGQISATLHENGQTVYLGSTSGDARTRLKVLSPPAGSTVEISAEGNADCDFFRWEIQSFYGSVTSSYSNTITHTSAQGGTTYRAFFTCD